MSTLLTSREAGLLRASSIVTPNGKPVSQYLYPSPRSNPQQFRPRQQLRPTTRENVNEATRMEMVNYSRLAYAQIGDLSTAIEQKNTWAFGDAWEPHSLAENTKWAEEAEEFLLNQFYPLCNVRGPLFPFRRTMLMSGMAWDYDGDDLLILTESESHFPQIALYPSTMVRSTFAGAGYGKAALVQGGRFDGAKIFDGIIFNRTNQQIAYRLWDDDGKYTDVPARSADLAFEPEWHDQARGIPKPSKCLLKWMNKQDIDSFFQDAMKRAATMMIQRVTAEGESVQGNEIITAEEEVTSGGETETRTIHMERIGSGGDVIELSAEDAEEIKVLDFKNPHPNSEAFIERLTRECLASVGWFYELLNLSSTGRAPTRLVANLANKTIWARQATGERRAKRVINYAIAKAMDEGLLSRNNDADAYKWDLGMPAEISVDAGNDEQAAREAVKMGMSSKEIEAAKKGYRAAAILKQNVQSVEAVATEAMALQKQFGLTVEYWMERLDQRSPNPVMPQQQKQQQSQSAKSK